MSFEREFNVKYKQTLTKNISKLDYNEQCEVYNIIKKDTDKISENNNGVFINLKYIKDETIQKVNAFVDYCNKNRECMKVEDKKYIEKKNIVLKPNLNISNDNLSHDYELFIEDTNQKETFLFKTYMDNMNPISKHNKNINILIKPNKVKLSGVNARILNKCKHMDKIQEDVSSEHSDNSFENDTNELVEDLDFIL